MRKKTNRRRQILVDKAVQGRIIFSVSWPSALCLVVNCALLAVFATRVADEAWEAGIVLDSVVPLFLTALLFLLLSTLFFVMTSLKMSHQIAGPIYRLRRGIQAMKRGDTDEPVRLRNGDYLMDLSKDLDELRKALARHPEVAAKLQQDAAPEAATREPATAGATDS